MKESTVFLTFLSFFYFIYCSLMFSIVYVVNFCLSLGS